MVPTESELRLARAALRQTMVPAAISAEVPRASIPADANDTVTRASSVWSDSPAQHKRWSCQKVMMTIPASTGGSDDGLPGCQHTITPEARAQQPTLPISPGQPLSLSGAQLADAWMRSPIGEEFMAAVVAADAKAEDAQRPVVVHQTESISFQPGQAVSKSDTPSNGVANSQKLSPIERTSIDGSRGCEVPDNCLADQTLQPGILQHSPHDDHPVGLHSSVIGRAEPGTPHRSTMAELMDAREEVKNLRAVLDAVQLLLPHAGAPQALTDVDAFVAELRCQMQAQRPSLTAPSPLKSVSSPKLVPLHETNEGRGLGKGKGLCLISSRISCEPSEASVPFSSTSCSTTPATVTTTSVRNSRAQVNHFWSLLPFASWMI